MDQSWHLFESANFRFNASSAGRPPITECEMYAPRSLIDHWLSRRFSSTPICLHNVPNDFQFWATRRPRSNSRVILIRRVAAHPCLKENFQDLVWRFDKARWMSAGKAAGLMLEPITFSAPERASVEMERRLQLMSKGKTSSSVHEQSLFAQGATPQYTPDSSLDWNQ